MNYSLPPIVVATYNRPNCLIRILDSIAAADYSGLDHITIIISIDYHEKNNKTLELAKAFNWPFGEKLIVTHDSNLGLRKHILECGNYAITYGNVILLEDDLFVAPTFYKYAIAALQFSKEKEYIGGIALYNHQLNVQTLNNFQPVDDGYDNWYLQYAASWGQAWTRNQWEKFLDWYKDHQSSPRTTEIPINVTYWSENSWLKYYIAYLIKKNKYFLYPKIGVSTNFSEPGIHNYEGSTAFQVNLRLQIKQKLNFSTLENSSSVYDAFFENIKLPSSLLKNDHSCEINLNNYKPLNKKKKFLLTTQQLPFLIVKTFGLSLKPIDLNILLNVPGNDIYLYDLSVKAKNKLPNNRYKLLIYNYKIITLKDSIFLTYKTVLKRLNNLRRKLTL